MKHSSVQTDKVTILPEPPCCSELSSSASYGIQSNANLSVSFHASTSHVARHNLQKNSYRDEFSSSSSHRSQTSENSQPNTNEKLPGGFRLRPKRPIPQKDRRYDVSSSASCIQHQRSFDDSRPFCVSEYRLHTKSAYDNRMQEETSHSRASSSSASHLRISEHCSKADEQNPKSSCLPAVNSGENASQSASIESRDGVMENCSAAHDSAHRLQGERRQRSRLSKARNASLSHEKERNHPQVADRSRQKAKASGRDRSNFSSAHVGAMPPASSRRPTDARSRKHSVLDAAASRPKYRRLETTTSNNWQPRYDQIVANRSYGFHPMWLPAPAYFLSSLYGDARMLFPRLPSVFTVPSVFFPTFFMPIPLWRLGRLW